MLPSEYMVAVAADQIPVDASWHRQFSSQMQLVLEFDQFWRRGSRSFPVALAPRVLQHEVMRSVLNTLGSLREPLTFGTGGGGYVVDVMTSERPDVTAGLVLFDSEPETAILDPGTVRGLAAVGLADYWLSGRPLSGMGPMTEWLLASGSGLQGIEFASELEGLEELLFRSEALYEREFFRGRGPSLPRLAGPLLDAASQMPLPIALSRQPRLERTHSPGTGASAGSGQFTLGALVSDSITHETGYLTCGHAIPPLKVGDQIRCNCVVERISDQWDAAFLLPGCLPGDSANTGLLSHRAPARGEWGYFVGAASHRQVAVVDSCDPILPHYRTGRFGQVGRFYTNRTTAPGDSGAVLVLQGTENGTAAGLGVARTEEGERIEYSVWMWLAGVLDELRVDLVAWNS